MPRIRRSAAIGITLLFVVLAAGYLLLALTLDLFQGGTGFAMAALLAAGGLPLVITAVALRRRWMIAVALLSVLLVGALSLSCWHPRKAFVRDVQSVEVGMTVDEVEGILGGYLKGPGAKFLQPTPPEYPAGERRTRATGVMIYRWNDTDGAYDADWGLVKFVDGRVTHRELLAD